MTKFVQHVPLSPSEVGAWAFRLLLMVCPLALTGVVGEGLHCSQFDRKNRGWLIDQADPCLVPLHVQIDPFSMSRCPPVR